MKHEVIFGSDVSVRAKSKAVVVKTTGCLNLAAPWCNRKDNEFVKGEHRE